VKIVENMELTTPCMNWRETVVLGYRSIHARSSQFALDMAHTIISASWLVRPE
jgi:hypothetical protein